MRTTKILKCVFLMVMIMFVVLDVGCAKQLIASKIQSELINQLDTIDIAAMVGMIMTALMSWIGVMVKAQIKNQVVQQAVLEFMSKYEKDMEGWLVGQGKWVVSGLKAEIGEIDFTKPIMPQLTQDAKDLLNKMKHKEVTAAVMAKTGASEAVVTEKVKSMAPMIKVDHVDPTSVTEPKPVSSFRSAESQALIEKLRDKIAKG